MCMYVVNLFNVRVQHAVTSSQRQGCDQEVPRARRPQLRNWPQPSNAQLAGPASECMYAHKSAERTQSGEIVGTHQSPL